MACRLPPEQSYTPDITHNLLHFVNLTGTQILTGHLLLSGNAYYRHLITGSNNGSNNDSYLDGDYPGPPIDCTAPLTTSASLPYCTTPPMRCPGWCNASTGAGLQLTDTDRCSARRTRPSSAAAYEDSQNEFVQAFLYGILRRPASARSTAEPAQ